MVATANRAYRVTLTDAFGTQFHRLLVVPAQRVYAGDIATLENLMLARATDIEDVTGSTEPVIQNATRKARHWRTLASRMAIIQSFPSSSPARVRR